MIQCTASLSNKINNSILNNEESSWLTFDFSSVVPTITLHVKFLVAIQHVISQRLMDASITNLNCKLSFVQRATYNSCNRFWNVYILVQEKFY